MTKEVKIGNIAIGGDAPIAVQSMLSKHYSDLDGNVEQSVELEKAGCDINRVSVPNEKALELIPAIKSATKMPLVADIHFDYRLAIKSVEMGVDKIRFNPGNIGSDEKAKMVIDCCRASGIPIRIGVNSGSLDKETERKHGRPSGQALFESAMRHVRLIENRDRKSVV